jgi:DNA-binding NarL/FixJ family response regulator
MSQTIRVVAVEREPVYRRGLVSVLNVPEDLEVVGSAETAEAAYTLLDETSPDVVLVGTTLADAPGLTLATELRRRYPAAATIVMAAQENDDELFAAIRAGAAAYCGRDVGEDTLFELVRRAAAGEYVINEQLLSKPYVAARVLGYALGISAQTVKNHVTSILRKLAVNDRTQAVVTALRRGWLTIERETPEQAVTNGVTTTPTSRLGSDS